MNKGGAKVWGRGTHRHQVVGKLLDLSGQIVFLVGQLNWIGRGKSKIF